MEPFTNELLTTLIIICIAWSGVTFIIIVVFFICLICKSSSKIRPRTSIRSTKKRSSVESVSTTDATSVIIPQPSSHQSKKIDKREVQEQRPNSDDLTNITNFHVNFSHDKNKNNQQKIDTYDKYDRTTQMHEYGTYNQSYQKQYHNPVKPISSIISTNRSTPYPPDVLARDTLMNMTRFPVDNE